MCEGRPVSPAAWRRVTLIAEHKGRVYRKASTIGQISTIRKLRDKNILGSFDLSEGLIVPIVSIVKTDPLPFGSAPRARANLTVNGLPSRLDRHAGIVAGCGGPQTSGQLFGRCRNAGRKRCMDTARTVYRRAGLVALLAFLAACGCQTVKTPEEKIANSNIPNEFKKVSMPDYVVEPPDLIVVEVLEALPGRPISGERLVRPDGRISLSFYGDVYVAGLTVPEVKEKIVLHLRKFLHDEQLGLIKSDEETGEPILDPKTNEYVRIEPRDSDRVFVDVTAYNSKNYYVLGDVAVPGKLPITGNETVLDALQFANGLMPTAAPQNIRLVRPAPPGACCEQTLPVNLAAITSGGDPTTNYQLMPGDRIIVYRDPIVRITVFIDRLAAPFQTVIGSMLQYSFTVRSIKFLSAPITGAGGTTGAARAPITNLPLEPGAR
jgi:polysaccharide export outer membrane protein